MKIDLVSDEQGDWIGIYVDGKLKSENHSLLPSDILEALNLKHNHYEIPIDGSLPFEFNKIEIPEQEY